MFLWHFFFLDLAVCKRTFTFVSENVTKVLF